MNNLFLNLHLEIRGFKKDGAGQDLVEYALLVALIALVSVIGVGNVASDVNTVFSNISSSLASVRMGWHSHGSTDASLNGTATGVYVGSKPAELKIDQQSVFGLQLSMLIYEGEAIKRRSSGDVRSSTQEEDEWSAKVENWLRTHVSEDAAIEFHERNGLEEKLKYLNSLTAEASQTNQP